MNRNIGSVWPAKAGSGSLTILTTNRYIGDTLVNDGSLLVHGSLEQSQVVVQGRGRIGGRGYLGRGVRVQPGGGVAPGNGVGSPGILTNTPGAIVLWVHASRPLFTKITISGTSVLVEGANGLPQAGFETLASPELRLPVNQWTPVSPGRFDSNGRFMSIRPIDPSTLQQFYLLQQQ